MPPKIKKNTDTDPSLGLVKIGSFESYSGAFIFSDPCYGHPTEKYDKKSYIKSFTMGHIKKGTWNIYARYIECDQIATAFAFHSCVTENSIRNLVWKKSKKMASVDSAQTGVFDSEHFRNDADAEGQIVVEYLDTDKGGDRWYGLCCKITRSDAGIGSTGYGLVCTTDWHDESYRIYKTYDGEEKVGVKILLVSPEVEIDKHSDDDEFNRLRFIPRTYIPTNDHNPNPKQYTITSKLRDDYEMSDDDSDSSKCYTPDNMKRTKYLSKEELRGRHKEIMEHAERVMGRNVPKYEIPTYVSEPITKSEISKMKINTFVRGVNAIKQKTSMPLKMRQKYYGTNEKGRRHYDSDDEMTIESPKPPKKTFCDKFDDFFTQKAAKY